ncbi:MAG: cell division protein FtsW [Lachnospiraceae bacterium]|nr:cell division protein FtsW [Lachnospiraceae bacterium]
MIFKKENALRGQVQLNYFDYNLLAVIILLTGFGLVMLYSTSSYAAQMQLGDDMYYFKKQAVISFVFILAAVGASFFDYHILWYLGIWLYAAAFVLIALVITPLGVTLNGARRWLRLGIQFQPAEIAKLAVIVLIPVLIIKMGRNFKGFRAVLIPFAAGFLLSFETYVITSNLSTAFIILGITSVIIFVAHPKTWPFIAALGVFAVFVLLVVLVIKHNMATGGGFRAKRILVWLDPEAYKSDGGWQIIQALYALGSGGFFGKGLGNSAQKMGYLPEAQNDMIFSIVCEELGVFGGIIVIFLFGYMLYRLYYIARNARDLYGSLIATGIFAHIMMQVILNISVVINLIPTTGITLPFISYGGTSVMFLMAEMALALSVSRQIVFKRPEKDLWGDIVQNFDF